MQIIPTDNFVLCRYITGDKPAIKSLGPNKDDDVDVYIVEEASPLATEPQREQLVLCRKNDGINCEWQGKKYKIIKSPDILARFYTP